MRVVAEQVVFVVVYLQVYLPIVFHAVAFRDVECGRVPVHYVVFAETCWQQEH